MCVDSSSFIRFLVAAWSSVNTSFVYVSPVICVVFGALLWSRSASMGLFSRRRCRSSVRLEGKVSVVTGCNTGIGRHTVLDLYSRGSRVIMACRNLEKAEEAKAWILHQCQDKKDVGSLEICQLDLSSLTSVRQCAQKIHDEEPYIHLLINNAGVMMCPRSLTEDGYELQFATNHLGHFLFTLILMPRILAAAPARIVNVSSLAHFMCRSLKFEDINLEKWYNPQIAYGRSKMANILFTRELARRLQGTGVTTYALHPGTVNTELGRHLDSAVVPGARLFWKYVGGLFIKSPEQGAQTSLYCALDEKTADENGLYYSDCKVTRPTALGLNDEVARKLWDVSLEMVKISPPPPFGKST